MEHTLMDTVNFEDHLLNVIISMMVPPIFTKIDNFVENIQIYMHVNCNCVKLAIILRFLNMLRGGVFPWTQCTELHKNRTIIT